MDSYIRDKQSVNPDGTPSSPFNIMGVKVLYLNNIITRSGSVTELYRSDWSELGIDPQHMILVTMNANAVTDWHCHSKQTDHLIAISGNIKLCLWDNRKHSPTKNSTDTIRMGILRPQIAIVPPGVWHGLRNESGEPSHYININEVPYCYENPDNLRVNADSKDIPVSL